MPVPIIPFLDRRDISWAFYKHLEGRFQNTAAPYAIAVDTAAKVDITMSHYMNAFYELCDLHGVDSSLAIQLFAIRAQGRPLKGEEAALWKKISHPAFLDVPDDLARWVKNVKVQFEVRDEIKVPIMVKDRVIGYYVNSLPQPQLRRIIHKLELTSNMLSEGDHKTYVSHLGDILAAASNAGFEHVTAEKEEFIPGVTPGIPADAIDILEALEQSKRLFVIDKTGTKTRAEILKQTVMENSRLTGETVDTMRRIDPQHLTDALNLSRTLSIHAKSRGIIAVPVSPTEMYDFLQDSKDTARDPILYAWAQKFLQEADGKLYQSLAEAWENAPASRHKPTNDTRIVKLLSTIDAMMTIGKPPVYSLNDFKRDTDKTNTVLTSISNLLMNVTSKEWSVKRDGKGGRDYIASDALQRIVARLSDFPADYFIEQPVYVAPVIAAKPARAAEPAVPAMVFKPLVPIQENIPKLQLLSKTVTLLLGDDPDAHEAARIKNLLSDAYDFPNDAIQGGLPSLPHMWLTWAADNASRSLPVNDLLKTFAAAWGHDPSRLDMSGSIKMSFAMAAIATMRDKRELYSDYQRYMEAATRALPSALRTSVPKFEKMLRLDNVEWNQSDRDAAPAALEWLDSHGIKGENFLGDRPQARRYVGRLRNFVKQAATAKR